MNGSFIEYEVTDGVASICLEKPSDPRAATSPYRITEYLLALQDADRDPGVGVVLCSTRASFHVADPSDGEGGPGSLAIPLTLARELSTPVVALLEGPVTGLALALALAADVRFASEATTLGPAGHDVAPDIAPILARAIGEARARELLLSGRTMSADEGRRIGLLHAVTRPDDLHERGRAYAEHIAREATPSRLAAIKGALATAG